MDIYNIVLHFNSLCLGAFVFQSIRTDFKISYYETKLTNRDVDIDRVKTMPWYKLWIN